MNDETGGGKFLVLGSWFLVAEAGRRKPEERGVRRRVQGAKNRKSFGRGTAPGAPSGVP